MSISMSGSFTRRRLLSLTRGSHITPFFLLRRFATETPPPSPPSPPSPPPYDRPAPPVIKPVSYAVKPKPEKPDTTEVTREDIRYSKYLPSQAQGYANRVAPLPEYRAPVAGELDRERRMIDSESRVIRRVFRDSVVEEENKKEVPFPTLIKVEKKSKEKSVLDLHDAIRKIKEHAKRKFDETLEAHVNLSIDRRRSDLAVNGAVVLPHGLGKNVKVAVFAEGAVADEARAAGADIVGGDELIEEIKTSGKINFDKCIATHSMMQRVTKISRILRGLTPNAKRGTVTNNVTGTVKEAKQGLLDFRMRDSIVHVGLGKVSFSDAALQENVGAFVNALLLAKPVGLKKTSKLAGYVNSFHLCSTMGPGFTVSVQSLSRAAETYSKLHPSD